MTYKPTTDRPLTAFGDLRTAELSPVVQGTFVYSVDNTLFLKKTVTGGGIITQSDAMSVVSTSTTPGSTAHLNSIQGSLYHAGLGGLARFTALFTAPIAGTEQYVGLASGEGSLVSFKNGYMVGYDGTTFGFHRFSNDVQFSIPQASWDDPMDGTGPSGMTLDQTKLNVFYIQFQYLGAGAIKLLIESDTTGDLIPVHTIDYANSNVEPSVHNPHFKFSLWVNNKATSVNMLVKSASFGLFTEGDVDHINLQVPTNSTGEIEKTSVTTETAILTIRNKSTYASKINLIDILLLSIDGSIEAGSANNLGKIRLVKNATLGGTPSYTDINTSDSVVEIDVAGTTVTGGVELVPSPLAGKNDSVSKDVQGWKILLHTGETLTIAGSSSNSATINASLTWHELF